MTPGDPLTELLNLPGQPVDPLGEQILDAALARFIEYGIRRTKVEDIAQAAGLNRVTIYRRFTDRSGLIKATIAREATRTMATITTAVAHIPDPQDQLVEAFALGAQLVKNHPLLDRLLRSEPEEIALHLTIHGGPVITAMRTIVTQNYLPHTPDPHAQRAHQARAEILVRLAISLVLTPQSCMSLDTDAHVRDSVRTYIAPLIGGDVQDDTAGNTT